MENYASEPNQALRWVCRQTKGRKFGHTAKAIAAGPQSLYRDIAIEITSKTLSAPILPSAATLSDPCGPSRVLLSPAPTVVLFPYGVVLAGLFSISLHMRWKSFASTPPLRANLAAGRESRRKERIWAKRSSGHEL